MVFRHQSKDHNTKVPSNYATQFRSCLHASKKSKDVREDSRIKNAELCLQLQNDSFKMKARCLIQITQEVSLEMNKDEHLEHR
jgi:hypothetical protein